MAVSADKTSPFEYSTQIGAVEMTIEYSTQIGAVEMFI